MIWTIFLVKNNVRQGFKISKIAKIIVEVFFLFKYSKDPECQFTQKPYLVSKIIATGVSPEFVLPEDSIIVVFEHAIVRIYLHCIPT